MVIRRRSSRRSPVEAKDAVTNAASAALEAEPDLRIRTSVGEGDAARTLLEVGKDATAIVIGNRRLGGVKGLLLGSVGVAWPPTTTVALSSSAVIRARAGRRRRR